MKNTESLKWSLLSTSCVQIYPRGTFALSVGHAHWELGSLRCWLRQEGASMSESQNNGPKGHHDTHREQQEGAKKDKCHAEVWAYPLHSPGGDWGSCNLSLTKQERAGD